MSLHAGIPPLRPGRRIEGISAVLLPFDGRARPDLDTYRAVVERTFAAGLIPAVNMDTGYANLLTRRERGDVLAAAAATAGGRRFVAGAFIEGEDGEPASLYRREVTEIREAGGTPILFQCSALAQRDEAAVLAVYREVAGEGGPLLAFELGTMFAPFGRIYSAELFTRLLLLQYLGFLAFRAPVPAYKHSAAQFLHLRGVIPADHTHPASPRRPASDLPLLRDVAERIGELLEGLA